MSSRIRHATLPLVLVLLTAVAGCGGGGGGDGGGPPSPPASATWVEHWNTMAIDASGLDHTPVAAGDDRVFGHQLGPGRASRAMAIVHVALFEAVNAITGGYQSYTGMPRAAADTSIRAAVAQAAHDSLVAMYPSHAPTFDAELAAELALVEDGAAQKEAGIDLGRRAAESILELRANDGSNHPEPRINVDYIPGDGPGEWRQDPVSLHPLALGGRWAEVRPFVMASADQFRIAPPPPLDSPEYAAAFAEVMRLGGDGIETATERTEDQTSAGIYWAYDGLPSLCAPPRLYNQVTMQLALERGADIVELARVLALVNVAMADAGIAIWESKYFYKFWRPVTAVREADEGTGPAGAGDGNPDTVGDPSFMPLGAPASNATGPNFTPPFPAYPSGHAGFGGSLFQMLRNVYGTDDIAFTFISDEYNGVTVDNQGNVRVLHPRSFTNLSQAEDENGQSRIYLGIHWSFDKDEGIQQGRRIADLVFQSIYPPAS